VFRHRLITAMAGATALSLAVIASAAAHDADNPHPGMPSETVDITASSHLDRIATTKSIGSVNTDLAFWGDTAYMGVYNGLQVVDISDPQHPSVVSDTACQGSQNDVSVWGDLLFISVDRPMAGTGCDAERTVDNAPGWEGIRIFDVSDPAHPTQIGTVATDCGSHTHTLLPDPDSGKVFVYVSSYASNSHTFGQTEWGNDCEADHNYISVVEVPLGDPTSAHVVSKNELPLTPYFKVSGGDGCHDVGVFPAMDLAAAACEGEALLLDVSDPASPVATDSVPLEQKKGYWHSGALTFDGKVAIFGDETFGGGGNACSQPKDDLGRIWFYGVDPAAKKFTSHTELSSYKIPRAQEGGTGVSCTAHNYNVLPIAGRYVLNASWYAGGVTVVDFSDPSKPTEIAYADYDNAKHYMGAWSSYWYNGYSYASSISTGLEVFEPTGQVDAGAVELDHLNPQTQEFTLPGV